jgi:RepB DNA-primase from phage plasmid
MKLHIDLEQTRRFLQALVGDGPGTFQTFDDDEKRKDPALARILHGTLGQHHKELTRLNKLGAGIFIMVNEGNLKGRATENVVSVRAVFVDLDGAPLQPVKDAPVKPHIIVQSSPGRYHAYWKVSDCTLEQFTPIQKALAQKFQGDPKVNDPPRVMRLPGFYHRKAEPFMTMMEPE